MLISSKEIGRSGFVQNKYFEEMHQRGYNIHVYQSEFMDFCAGYENMVVSCRINRDTGIEPLQYLDLSPPMKAWLALDTFSRLSVLCRGFDYRYNALRQKALSRGYDLPPWVLNRFTLWAVRGVRALQEIEDDVSSAPAGEMFFAHLLFPHHPYVYGPTCKARDPQHWEMSDDDPPLPPNSDASRARRYGLYLQQILCIRAPAARDVRPLAANRRCTIACSSSFRATMAQGSGCTCRSRPTRIACCPQITLMRFRHCSPSRHRASRPHTTPAWWQFRICSRQ